MKNVLVDFDSSIPNLALMQLSSYLKLKGETVKIIPANTWDGERVWISCIFTWNAKEAFNCAYEWGKTAQQVFIGGTGIDFYQDQNMRLQKINDSHIPHEAESMPPDYSLYPNDKRAVGFVARGCNRKCEFCVVPLKEGRIGPMWPIREWNQERSQILLLDNDLPLGPYHNAVLQECEDEGFDISITQGYDIRCVARGDINEDGLKLLADNMPWDLDFRVHRLYIAWDYLGIEGYVRQGLERLKDHGIRLREIMCYILCGFNTTHEQDYYRFKVLWNEYGVMPFVMTYNKRKDDKWLTAFARWVNRGYGRFVPFDQYNGGILQELFHEQPPLAGQPITIHSAKTNAGNRHV